MDELLNELDILLERFRFYLEKKFQGILNPVHITLFNDFATKWKDEANRLSSRDIKNFFKENKLRFYKIHDTLVGSFAQNYLPCNEYNKLRSAHDIIFRSIYIIRPATVFNHLPTQLFTEFCKGITYFKNQNVKERQIYHRKNSCGSGSKTIAEKFKKQYSYDKIVSNKEHMRTCYIERLIYDDIYFNTLHYQDFEHNEELLKMIRLYDDIYKGSIRIEIWYKYKTPIEIKITTKAPKNFNEFYMIEEQYIKSPNSNIVRCNKSIKYIDNSSKNYYKVQTFDKEEKWIEGGNGILYPTIKEQLLGTFSY